MEKNPCAPATVDENKDKHSDLLGCVRKTAKLTFN